MEDLNNHTGTFTVLTENNNPENTEKVTYLTSLAYDMDSITCLITSIGK